MKRSRRVRKLPRSPVEKDQRLHDAIEEHRTCVTELYGHITNHTKQLAMLVGELDERGRPELAGHCHDFMLDDTTPDELIRLVKRRNELKGKTT